MDDDGGGEEEEEEEEKPKEADPVNPAEAEGEPAQPAAAEHFSPGQVEEWGSEELEALGLSEDEDTLRDSLEHAAKNAAAGGTSKVLEWLTDEGPAVAERILSSRTRGYEGNLVERVGEITADLVIGAWPQVGEAAVADVVSRGEPDNLKMVPYPAHLWRMMAVQLAGQLQALALGRYQRGTSLILRLAIALLIQFLFFLRTSEIHGLRFQKLVCFLGMEEGPPVRFLAVVQPRRADYDRAHLARTWHDIHFGRHDARSIFFSPPVPSRTAVQLGGSTWNLDSVTIAMEVAVEFLPALGVRLKAIRSKLPSERDRSIGIHQGSSPVAVDVIVKALAEFVKVLSQQSTPARLCLVPRTAIGEDVPQVLAVLAMLNFQKFSGLLLLNLAMPSKITAAPFGPRAMVSSLEVFCCVKITGIVAIRWNSGWYVLDPSAIAIMAAPLSAAIAKNASDSGRMLLCAGATPLMAAANLGDTEILVTLLNSGADK
ncbi:hypothetical protein AK812_SmicGene43421, partial [Symbiodinium microadriaticum]